MNIPKLLELATVLESPRAEKHFHMSSWIFHNPGVYGSLSDEEYETKRKHHDAVENMPLDQAINDCNTVACIGGWTVILDPVWKKRTMNDIMDVEERAQQILDISIEQSAQLFCPWNTDQREAFRAARDPESDTVSPKQAAKVVRHLAATGEVDWSILVEEKEVA